MTKQFVYPVVEVGIWTGRAGEVVLRDLQQDWPDEIGVHPDQKRWAVTYAAADAYAKRCLAHDSAYQAKQDAFRAACDRQGQEELEFVAAAREKPRKEAEKRYPLPRVSVGPAGASGHSLHRGANATAQIRDHVAQAAEAARAEWARRHPPLTMEQFEKTYKP